MVYTVVYSSAVFATGTGLWAKRNKSLQSPTFATGCASADAVARDAMARPAPTTHTVATAPTAPRTHLPRIAGQANAPRPA